MNNIHIQFVVKESETTDLFDVIKETYSMRYGCFSSNDKTESLVMVHNIEKWKANYISEMFSFYQRSNYNIEYNENTLNVLVSTRKIDINRLVYQYILTSLGDGWSFDNAYKLKLDRFIELWLNGYSFVYGVLDIMNINSKEELYNKFKESVQKCINEFYR